MGVAAGAAAAAVGTGGMGAAGFAAACVLATHGCTLAKRSWCKRIVSI